jgi:hypothetical protein
MPWGVLGWDVGWWLGLRRVARHWSVGQIRAELADTDQRRWSDEAMAPSIHRDHHLLAARPPAPSLLAAASADVEAVLLASEGLQRKFPPDEG